MGEMKRAVFVGATRELLALEAEQNNRLLLLGFPMNDKPDGGIMLVNKLVAYEGISRDFRFEVDVLSDDARIPLKGMMGRMVTISLVREDGSLRYFNGYVTDFRLNKADGGYAHYGMVLEPWFAFAKLRKNSAVFREQTVVDITKAVLAQYDQHDWQLALGSDYEPLSCAIQYDETDHNHLHRRWEDLGLHYWYEHREDGHTLWLGDDTQTASPIDPCGNIEVPDEIPFTRNTGAEEADGIHKWQPIRQASPDSMTVGGFDYKSPRPQLRTRDSRNEQGKVPQLEVYENTKGYSFASFDAGDAVAKRRMEETDGRAQFFEASGNDRSVQPRRSFTLGGHFSGAPRPVRRGEPAKPSIDRREYIILSVKHTASNNYQMGRGAESQYTCSFTCMRKDITWRPGRGFNSKPVVMLGVQTAIVVGPSGSEIHTDEYGRVKVQFHWDREGQNNESSSAWVRVASVWAGSEHGFIAVPRIGQEVAVQWIAGNPDHPLIVGRVFNGNDMPPWALPGQQALSGIRSRELTPQGGNAPGGRSNHLIFDDTNGQIQVQLKSDHQHSQLSLGYITRIEGNRGRTTKRGEGWEIASDAYGVARAARGMLLTTEARLNTASSIKDMGETVQRLSTAADLQQQLSSMAKHYDAQDKEEPHQEDIVDAIKSQNHGIQGNGKAEFPELAEPHLVLASPAGIELSSAESTHIASTRHTAITSGKSLSIASIDGLFASVGKTFRLFVHKAGMKLIAAGGKVTVQAQEDDVNIIANKVLTLLSESDWITIKGRKGIRLQGGNHMLEISDQTQFFTSSPVIFHGNLETLASKSVSQALNEKVSGYHFDQEVNFLETDGKPAKNIAYELIRDDGTVINAKTGTSGSTGVQKGTALDSYIIRWKGELP
jgi:type VI secretion system secreted protein VgrG